MELNKILSADILDILFEKRNKSYGAYELRKTYNKRLTIALVSTISVCLLFFLGSLLANSLSKNNTNRIVEDVKLEDIKKQEEKKVEPPPPPPPPKQPPPPKIKMEKFTPPVIVKDEEVKEPPPKQEELEEVKIADVKQEGVKDEGIVAPPVEKESVAIVEAPKVVEEDYDKVFTKVENEAEFPGGRDGWRRYLERSLQYPDAAQENGTQGTVRVEMVVDKDGGITEVKALNDPGDGLAEEAERVIRKGPKWKPAEQNGRKVTYRFTQTVTFALQ